jgi:hypothetical protein
MSFVTPITIVPTQEQINNATRFVRYGDIPSPISEICPITLERFNMNDVVRQIHHCGHIFSNTAFNEWFHSSVRCPVCRYDIREYNSNTVVSNNDNNDSIPNTNVVTESNSNEVTIDLPNEQTTENLLNTLSSRLLQGLLNPTNQNQNDRFMYDASNNIIMFETVLRSNI